MMKTKIFLVLCALTTISWASNLAPECKDYVECRIPFKIHSGLFFGSDEAAKLEAHNEYTQRCQSFQDTLKNQLGSLLTYVSCGSEHKISQATYLKKTFYFQSENSKRNLRLETPTVFSGSIGMAIMKYPLPKYVFRLVQKLSTKEILFSPELFPAGTILEYVIPEEGAALFPADAKALLSELNADYELRCRNFVSEAKQNLGGALVMARCEDPQTGRRLAVHFKEVQGKTQAYLSIESMSAIYYQQ